MDKSYEKLPVVDLNAPKVTGYKGRAGRIASKDAIKHYREDAEKIMSHLGLDMSLVDKIEAREKYMIETVYDKVGDHSSVMAGSGMVQGGRRKPHYTHLFTLGDRMIFQAACCLPLMIIAASLDNNSVSGRVLYSCHSGNEGGKLVYEIQGKGSELIIDIKRGDGAKVQRLIFEI